MPSFTLGKSATIFLLGISLISCSHFNPHNPHHDVVKEEHLKPQHGGKLIEGKDYIIEVVSTEKEVAIYPMKYSEKRDSLEGLPLDKVDIYASYSYVESVKGEGTKGRPTQKGEVSIPLEVEDNAFVGKIKAEDMEAYMLNVKLKYKDDKDKYRQMVQL